MRDLRLWPPLDLRWKWGRSPAILAQRLQLSHSRPGRNKTGDGTRMKRSSRVPALLCVCLLAGCDSFRLFNDYTVVESPDVATAPWPELVDTPTPPPPGEFSSAVPDPMVGQTTQQVLTALAEQAQRRREATAGPLLTEAERARLTGQ
jgi:hypothetical protein